MKIEERLASAKFKVRSVSTERRIDGDTTIEVMEQNSRVVLKAKFKCSDDKSESAVRKVFLDKYKNYLETNSYINSIDTVQQGDTI